MRREIKRHPIGAERRKDSRLIDGEERTQKEACKSR